MSVTNALLGFGNEFESTKTHSRISLLHFVFILTFVIVAAVGCTLTKSGEAVEPVSSVPLSPSAAGISAMSDGLLDPVSCEGVLGTPPTSHTLELQALTETVQDSAQQINTMCAAGYKSSIPDGPFLVVTLIEFDSVAPAIVRYDMLKNVYSSQDYPISELNNADDSLLDWFSALMDNEGIGRTTVLRLNNWVLTISNGPIIAGSPWTTDDLRIVGESIIRRAQREPMSVIFRSRLANSFDCLITGERPCFPA